MKDLEDLLKLPLEERIEIWQALYDSIAQENSSAYVVDEETKSILEERLADYKANPNAGRDWDTVRKEIQNGK